MCVQIAVLEHGCVILHTCVHACRCMCAHGCQQRCSCTCVHVFACGCVQVCGYTCVCTYRGVCMSVLAFSHACACTGVHQHCPRRVFWGRQNSHETAGAQGREVQLCSTARCTAACRTARSTAASGCWDAGMRQCTEHTLTHTVGQSERLSTAVHSYRSAKRSQKDHQPAQLGLAVRGGTGWLRALRASPWRQRCPLPELPHPAALLTCLYALSRITHSTRGQRVNAQCSAGGAANPQLVAGASSLLPKHSSGPVAEFLHHCSVISVHCTVCSACGSSDSCSFSTVTAYLQPRS